jgi:hypothetical protein
MQAAHDTVSTFLQSIYQVVEASKKLSESFKNIGQYEDSNIDKTSYEVVSKCIEKSSHHVIGMDASTNVHLLETFRMIGIGTMNNVKPMLTSTGDEYSLNDATTSSLSSSKTVLQEWSTYRNIRSGIMLQHLLMFASQMSLEVSGY